MPKPNDICHYFVGDSGGFCNLCQTHALKIFFVLQSSLQWSAEGASFYFKTDDNTKYLEGPHFSPIFVTSFMNFTESRFRVLGIYTDKQYCRESSVGTLIRILSVAGVLLHVYDTLFYSRLNLKLGIPDEMIVLGTSVLRPALHMWMYVMAVLIIYEFLTDSMAAMIYALSAGCHFLGFVVAKNGGVFLLQTKHVQPNRSLNESEQFAKLWKCNIIASTLPLFQKEWRHRQHLILVRIIMPPAAPSGDVTLVLMTMWKTACPQPAVEAPQIPILEESLDVRRWHTSNRECIFKSDSYCTFSL